MLFEIGQIISCEHVKKYIKELSDIDEEILDMYTGIFSSFTCQKVFLNNLDYSRINRDEESDIIDAYSQDIEHIPPIITSPSFDGKRIVYDGCHRCAALESKNVSEVVALIPYMLKDGRIVEDVENNKAEMQNCRYGAECKSVCCLCCEYNSNCGEVCSHCFELGSLYKIVNKNISLFCDGVW